MQRFLYGALWTFMSLCGCCLCAHAQEKNSLDRLMQVSDRWLQKAQYDASHMQQDLTVQSEKYLKKQAAKEALLKGKLCKTDSVGANQLFGNIDSNYARPLQAMKDAKVPDAAQGKEYLPYLDSLKGNLLFLKQHESELSSLQLSKLNAALGNVNGLEAKLQQSAQIKAFMKERQQLIADFVTTHTQLPKGFTNVLADYKKETYYYSQQLHEYKELWKNPDQAAKKVLAVISKVPAFQAFMKEHSELAGLFRLPQDYGSPASMGDLQTQSMVQDQVQRFAAAGGPGAQQMMQDNMEAAKGKLDNIKANIQQAGNIDGDPDMPDFKPNHQKTKSFLQRLEYGSNLQTAKSTSFFPTTTDVALSLGYKLNDNNAVGIGASYKIGWGKNIQHIALSSQGVGLRSYLDFKLKGSFFLSGGLEYNYQQPFAGITDINNLDKWQQSGLIGISKIVSLKTNSFKKTSVQLLWDFLSYSQVPRTQPIKFRMGYKF